MHTVSSRREWACLKEGNRESALGVEYWKIMFFWGRKIMFLLGNHKRIAEEIRCDPPTVGKEGHSRSRDQGDADMAEGEA